jgi:hypothetical protein
MGGELVVEAVLVDRVIALDPPPGPGQQPGQLGLPVGSEDVGGKALDRTADLTQLETVPAYCIRSVELPPEPLPTSMGMVSASANTIAGARGGREVSECLGGGVRWHEAEVCAHPGGVDPSTIDQEAQLLGREVR